MDEHQQKGGTKQSASAPAGLNRFLFHPTNICSFSIPASQFIVKNQARIPKARRSYEHCTRGCYMTFKVDLRFGSFSLIIT